MLPGRDDGGGRGGGRIAWREGRRAGGGVGARASFRSRAAGEDLKGAESSLVGYSEPAGR